MKIKDADERLVQLAIASMWNKRLVNIREKYKGNERAERISNRPNNFKRCFNSQLFLHFMPW